jgi:hypothetical protein
VRRQFPSGKPYNWKTVMSWSPHYELTFDQDGDLRPTSGKNVSEIPISTNKPDRVECACGSSHTGGIGGKTEV